jgi:hypothetical protein
LSGVKLILLHQVIEDLLTKDSAPRIVENRVSADTIQRIITPPDDKGSIIEFAHTFRFQEAPLDKLLLAPDESDAENPAAES